MWTTVRRITREILEEKELLQRIHLTAPHISKVASHQLCIHEPTGCTCTSIRIQLVNMCTCKSSCFHLGLAGIRKKRKLCRGLANFNLCICSRFARVASNSHALITCNDQKDTSRRRCEHMLRPIELKVLLVVTAAGPFPPLS